MRVCFTLIIHTAYKQNINYGISIDELPTNCFCRLSAHWLTSALSMWWDCQDRSLSMYPWRHLYMYILYQFQYSLHILISSSYPIKDPKQHLRDDLTLFPIHGILYSSRPVFNWLLERSVISLNSISFFGGLRYIIKRSWIAISE